MGPCGRVAIWRGELSPGFTPGYAFLCSEHIGWLELFWRKDTMTLAKPEEAPAI